MILRDKINNMSNRDLAKMLVKEIAEEDYDYDWEEELMYNGITYSYKTTDGETYMDEDDAIEWQIKLLEGEYDD